MMIPRKDLILIVVVIVSIAAGLLLMGQAWRAADVAAECQAKCKPRASRMVLDRDQPASASGQQPALICECYWVPEGEG
jgi:hypothetical protein